MFSLFICVTQDGWLRIVDEFTTCGHNILGPIYLMVYITLGAFIFANLVVAVVVTNLEWVIEQKNERIKKITSKKDATQLPSSACEELFNIAPSQIPKKFERRSLDKYLVFLGSLEDNFTEFRRLKEELTKIEQEIQALEVLDEVSNEELLELTNMFGAHDPKSLRKPSRANLVQGAGGDVITEMLGMIRKSPQTVTQAKSIHHMIAQLVQRKPSSDPNSSRRPSFLIHPHAEHATHRSDSTGFEDPYSTHRSSTRRRSSDVNDDEGPSTQAPSAKFPSGARRHTLSSVPGYRVKSSKK